MKPHIVTIKGEKDRNCKAGRNCTLESKEFTNPLRNPAYVSEMTMREREALTTAFDSNMAHAAYYNGFMLAA